MSEFIDAFRLATETVLAECPGLKYEWIDEPQKPKLTLDIPSPHSGGFGVRLECESYGLYPYAGDWHGSCWDVTVFTPENLKPSVIEFLRSVLSPESELKVFSSGGRPYKWSLKVRFDGEMTEEGTGGLFFNWFGSRSAETFQNRVLPPNQPLHPDALTRAGERRR